MEPRDRAEVVEPQSPALLNGEIVVEDFRFVRTACYRRIKVVAPELGGVVDGLALAGGDLLANVVRYLRNLVVGWRDKLLVLPIVEDARRRG